MSQSHLAQRIGRNLPAAALVALIAVVPAHAERKTKISPYIGLDTTVLADLNGGSTGGSTDVYSSATIGVDVHMQGRASEVQASLAYEHQFAWDKGKPDNDVISGLVQARVDLLRNKLSIEGGALATRIRTDGFTGANNSIASASSKSQVYSVYVGPTYRSRLGDLDVNAAYRLGYNRVESGFDAALANAPNLDSFDESWTQYATASVGMQADVWLPIGWSVGVGYEREDASQLDQRFEDKWSRLDVTLPLTPSLAAIGGVGYESIKASNRDALRDVNGDPVRDGEGRFITDESAPRLLSYDQDELIWDVGLEWRPSRRTSLELTAGHRYGSMSYTGSFSWQPDSRSSVNVSLFDSVDSFGRSLNGGLANLPENFVVTRNPFSGDLTGCTFGSTGGDCLGDTLSGIRTANYRNRGITASYTHRAGPWNYGIGVGYSRRKFLGNDPIFVSISGRKDENYFGAMSLGYAIDDLSGINANLYANQFNSGITGIDDVFNAGANVTYRRQLRKLEGSASVGVDSVKRSGVDSVLTGLAQAGLRYQF